MYTFLDNVLSFFVHAWTGNEDLMRASISFSRSLNVFDKKVHSFFFWTTWSVPCYGNLVQV